MSNMLHSYAMKLNEPAPVQYILWRLTSFYYAFGCYWHCRLGDS